MCIRDRLKGVALPAGLGLTTDLSCVRGCKIVVLATPSFAVRSTAHRVAPLLDAETVLVSVSKGIEKETSGTLTQAIQAEVGAEHPVVAQMCIRDSSWAHCRYRWESQSAGCSPCP